MAKEGYAPTSGMKSAAKRAIKLKEQGKAKGAGTAVGWTRAGQLARGETLSLSTVKRMYSFFSRHEQSSKGGKDWDNAENPSNGKIMWLAWGGDAGFSWSRKIVEREKNMKKSLEAQEIVEEIKDMLEDVVNPAEIVIEIDSEIDEGIEKAKDKFKDVVKPRKGDPSNKKLYATIIAEAKKKFDVYPSAYANGWVVQEYKRRGGKYNVSKAEGIEAGFSEDEIEEIESLIEKKYEDCGCETCKAEGVSCDDCSKCSEEMSKSYESDDEDMDKWDNIQKACWDGYEQRGMKDKGGRKVPNCVYVGKSADNDEDDDKSMEKSLWGGSLDPKNVK